MKNKSREFRPFPNADKEDIKFTPKSLPINLKIAIQETKQPISAQPMWKQSPVSTPVNKED